MAFRFNTFKKDITIGDKYRPAMEITDQTEADLYFEKCVRHTLAYGEAGIQREKAEEVERANLGYFAGYYGSETRERVERLFNCVHPVFGAAKKGLPIEQEAIVSGVAMAVGAAVEHRQPSGEVAQ